MIREAVFTDLEQILDLYLHLHERKIPGDSDNLKNVWKNIIDDENYHLIVAEIDGRIVSSVTCVIIPNLTRNLRPYALVENVVTNKEYRERGLATQCLNFAREIAKENDCYKMMLLTGSKKRSVHRFYRKSGYNSFEKTAYIQRL